MVCFPLGSGRGSILDFLPDAEKQQRQDVFKATTTCWYFDMTKADISFLFSWLGFHHWFLFLQSNIGFGEMSQNLEPTPAPLDMCSVLSKQQPPRRTSGQIGFRALQIEPAIFGLGTRTMRLCLDPPLQQGGIASY